MNLSFTSPKLTFLMLLSLLLRIHMILSQKIIISQLRSVESADNGLSQIINNPSPDEPLEALSVFGWIKIISPNQVGSIFSLHPTEKSRTFLSDSSQMLFSLSYISWERFKLGFTCFDDIHGESATYINLKPEELNSWIFIYAGHSFTDSRQTYYKRTASHHSEGVIKQITLKKPFKYYLLIAGCGSYLQQSFFSGDIERLSVHFGKDAYEESNFQRFQALSPETILKCPLAFTQCGYVGESLELCREVSGQREIKSIFMGELNEQIEFCFGEYLVLIKRDIECLTEYDSFKLQLEGLIAPNWSSENNQCII